MQRNVIVSAQIALARYGLYREQIDGIYGPAMELSLRAYQARTRLPVTGRLDLETLAALRLLPGPRQQFSDPYRQRMRPIAWAADSRSMGARLACFGLSKRTDCNSAKTVPTKICASMRRMSRSASSDTQIVARRNFLCGSNSRCLSDAFELQIKLDRVVSAGAHGDFFSSGYSHGGQIGICCRVNRQRDKRSLV